MANKLPPMESDYMKFLKRNSEVVAKWPRWKRELYVNADPAWQRRSPEEREAWLRGAEWTTPSPSYTQRKTWYIVCEKCDLISVPGFRYCFLHDGLKDPLQICDYYDCAAPRRERSNSCFCHAHDEFWKRYFFDREATRFLHWLVFDDAGDE